MPARLGERGGRDPLHVRELLGVLRMPRLAVWTPMFVAAVGWNLRFWAEVMPWQSGPESRGFGWLPHLLSHVDSVATEMAEVLRCAWLRSFVVNQVV